MRPVLARRIHALQAEMAKAGMDAIVFADRENLIYYAGTTDIECMAAVIPAEGMPILCCLWMDAPYVSERTGAERIIAYGFPASSIGLTIVEAMNQLGLTSPRVGFHKYFVEFAVFDAMRKAFPAMEFLPATELTYRIRSRKDADELVLMRRACSFVEAGMAAAVGAVHPGMTEVAVLAEAEYAMRKAGSEGSPFRMQVLTHAKQMLAHPYASERVIDDNQPVVIHLGASCQGYVAKMCRTVALGTIPDETRRIHQVLARAQALAVSLAVPGARSADIFDVVHALVASEGYGTQLIDHLGYGVGIRQSEFFPIIGRGLSHVLDDGMVVDLLLPTILKPGVGGPRLTDMVQVAPGGGMFMTQFTRDLIEK
jgi:Xaa-Pro aminopeptidase